MYAMMISTNKIFGLVTEPRKFFKELYQDNNYKKHIIFLLYVSILFVVIWFARIFYLIFSPNHFNDTISLYAELFKVIDIRTFGIFILFLLVDIIAIFVFSIVIAFIAKIASSLFKIKFDFRYYWKITCYVTGLIIPIVLIQFLLDIMLLSEFYLAISVIAGLYSIILLIFGVRVFSEQKNKPPLQKP